MTKRKRYNPDAPSKTYYGVPAYMDAWLMTEDVCGGRHHLRIADVKAARKRALKRLNASAKKR